MYSPGSIHNIKHLVKAFLGHLEFAIHGTGLAADELLVLNYHGTQKKFMNEFIRQIDFISKHFTIISPTELDTFFSESKLPATKPHALITFDDGIKNNLHAAAYLSNRHISALFFVIPGFINCSADKQREYFIANIRPQVNKQLDDQMEDVTAISWEELKSLTASGHIIGSHSYSHTLVAGKQNAEQLELEIALSKKEIAEKVNAQVHSFCAPNDSLFSCGKDEMKHVQSNYEYFFSTFPGSNISREKFLIRRANVEAHWWFGAFLYSISKWNHKRWLRRITEFRSRITGD